MPLLVVGVLLLLLKVFELGPVGGWSWWVVLAPFGLAAVWWQIADSTGYTQRKAIEKMEKRKVERRDRALEALGGQNRQRDLEFERARARARASLASADPTQADHSAGGEAPTGRDPSR